jgi:hypothetical protein
MSYVLNFRPMRMAYKEHEIDVVEGMRRDGKTTGRNPRPP